MEEERKKAKEALEKIIAAGFNSSCYGGSKGNILVGELYRSGSTTFHMGPEDWLYGFMWSHRGSWGYKTRNGSIGKVSEIYFSDGILEIHFKENGKTYNYELHEDRRTLPEKERDNFNYTTFQRFTVNDVIRIAKKYAESREIPLIGVGYSFIDPVKFKGRIEWKKK